MPDGIDGRRRRRNGAKIFSYVPGTDMTNFTDVRGTTATYNSETVEPGFYYLPGNALALITVRATVASYQTS
jgi:hypothetical protein